MNNIYITVWKNTVNILIESAKKIFNDFDEEKYISEYAEQTYFELYNKRPDKSKSCYEQSNEEQKAFIEYLYKVMKEGKL